MKHSPMHRLSAIGGLVAVALVSSTLAGCRTARQVAAQYPRSDIETIYAAALDNPERNPVVLVHGFAGATLQRVSDGATVWGAFFTDDSLLPSKQAGLTAFALDIARLGQPLASGDLRQIADDSQAVELLQRVKADAGIAEFGVGVYAALVDLVEAAGYSPCTSNPDHLQNLTHPPCLTFFYDWRQDNVGNAIRLGQFLESARTRIRQLASGADPRESLRFDVIAHSMGGLVARYLLRYGARDVLAETAPEITWAGAEWIDRLIVISAPNFGSMKVLREMLVGRNYPIVDFEPAMILTWVSPFQMLPRAHHALWLNEEGQPIDLDILSTELWRENGWGPFARDQDKFLAWVFPHESSPRARQERMAVFMDAAFDRARRFHQVMDRHPERRCPAEMILFAADVQPTMARAVLIEKKGRRELHFELKGLNLREPGDGAVTRASAVGDERQIGKPGGYVRSPIPWDRQIFLTDMHLSFLGNPTFQNNLLHILLEVPPRRAGRT